MCIVYIHAQTHMPPAPQRWPFTQPTYTQSYAVCNPVIGAAHTQTRSYTARSYQPPHTQPSIESMESRFVILLSSAVAAAHGGREEGKLGPGLCLGHFKSGARLGMEHGAIPTNALVGSGGGERPRWRKAVVRSGDDGTHTRLRSQAVCVGGGEGIGVGGVGWGWGSGRR